MRGWRGSWTQAQIPLLTSPDNETGILQPVMELFSALRASAPPTRVPILLHTDAAQAIGKIPVSGPELGADLVTIVGHKFYGPRIGALYHRKGVAVSPMFYGGGQEAGLRPGTENTPVIAGLGAACGLVKRNLDSLVTADETNTRLGLGEVQTGTEHNPHLHRELEDRQQNDVGH